MADQKPKAPGAAGTPPDPAPETGTVETGTAETKLLSEVEEVVVTVGPRLARYKNEMREIEPTRQQVYTRAWWESLYKDADGDVVPFKAVLDGYPIWNEDKTAYTVGPLADAE